MDDRIFQRSADGAEEKKKKKKKDGREDTAIRYFLATRGKKNLF